MRIQPVSGYWLPALVALLACLPAVSPLPAAESRAGLVFRCSADNDLYRVVTACQGQQPRYDTAVEAVQAAPHGAGVLILADGYPRKTTELGPSVLDLAAKKKLRLYVEYPGWLPEMTVEAPRPTRWERAVVASDAFGPSLEKLRILAIHDCHFVPLEAASPHLVVARVAGYDTAVFGLEDIPVYPLLFKHAQGNLLVATTKLSQFVTARYAPRDAWRGVWRMVLGWLRPGQPPIELQWTPTVRPSYLRGEPLPADAELQAVRRGAQWYRRARLLVHASWADEVRRWQDPKQDVNAGMTAAAPPADWPIGDGRQGMLEGHSSIIRVDGSQPVRWMLRSDCNSESAMALAMQGQVDDDPRSAKIAANLMDFVYFDSDLQQGPRADPASPSFGLIGWYTGPRGSGIYYGDDNARVILATMAAAAVLKSDRWDEPMLKCVLANFRTSGALGFRGCRLDEPGLERLGWQSHARRRLVNLRVHYESWLWACYLWLYDKTNYRPLLERARSGIRLTMQAYPHDWQWTLGQQQLERARMLLPLAWLIRVEDKPEYRAWLRRLCDDLLAHQDACGAIQEQIAWALKSNAEYGTCETSLIQQNGDPVADMLYVSNFALLGLGEAAAATSDEKLARAADRLAQFLVRVQTRSEAHPDLDGAWLRGFDFRRWEYGGANGDSGWGAWCTETGWMQAWIVAGLAMRQAGTTLWELTAGSQIAAPFEKVREAMIPDDALQPVAAATEP